MPSYDAGWDGPSGWNPARGAGAGMGMGPRGGYGGDFRSFPGAGGGRVADDRGPQPLREDGQWESGNVHGPARYGLGPYHHRVRTRRRPDDEVKKDVEDALFYDTWVDAEAITVEVKDGVVTLRGELPDYHEVRYATDDTWDVDGVRGVHSELTVNSAKRPPVDEVGRRSGGNGRGRG
ncbi:MAG TPA: BON domain-containing protein [Longimicrobium sp.]|uniref:BON domain-containing protein n=1 Tax=Longimicrobium sp. TaxID=2029185 RepID=UPI002ED7E1D3